jgi:hypothetical protein
MGLFGCPASFQRLVELAMRGLLNVMVYIDDLLVHSKNHAEHKEQLEKTILQTKETQALNLISANMSLDQIM